VRATIAARGAPANISPQISQIYLSGHSGGQVGIGISIVTLCLGGMAWTAKIPAAASASQSDIVSFFMLILLELKWSRSLAIRLAVRELRRIRDQR